jgi:hypothetical protein
MGLERNISALRQRLMIAIAIAIVSQSQQWMLAEELE